MLNIDDPAKPETLPAIWRLGFRPFFLGGAALAAAALPLWLMALYTPQYARVTVLPLWWHPHELLFGFALAIVAGFLLTAVQTWTSQTGMKGMMLGVTFGCWLLARVLLLLPVSLPVWLPALFDSLFLLLTAGKLWQSIYKVRQWRNIVFPPLILLAALVNLLSYYALATQDLLLASRIWHSMIWWVALLITLVGGRVIPFFTARRLNLEKPGPVLWLDWTVLVATALLALQAMTLWLPVPAVRLLLLAGGALQLWRALRWHPHRTLGEPLLWSLHLSYLCLPLTMLGLAWGYGDAYAERQLIHLLAVGCIGGMCLAMMARVSLGHTSRNIYQGPAMAPAFALVILAALIRAFGPLLVPGQTPLWHWLSGGAWCLSFALFVVHYTAILSQPRIDGRPG